MNKKTNKNINNVKIKMGIDYEKNYKKMKKIINEINKVILVVYNLSPFRPVILNNYKTNKIS